MIPKPLLPHFDDLETARRAKLLCFVLLTLMFAVCILIALFLLNIQNLQSRVYFPLAILLGFALLCVTLRAGYVRATSIATILFLWAVITFWGYRTGGVFSPAYGAYIVVVLVSGLLLGLRGSLFFAFLVVFSGFVLTVMGRSNVQAIVGLSSVFVWAIASILILFAALLLGLSTRGMKAAIDQLRDANQQLQQEIKQHQHTQLSLRMSEEKYRNLFMSMPLSAYTKDLEGRYTSSNSVHHAYYPDGDPTGKTDADLQPAELAERIRHNDLEVMRIREKLIIEENYVVPDGKIHLFRSHKVPLYDENGQVVGVMGSSRDITEIRKMEEQLDHYFNLSVDLMCIAGTDGYIRRMNPAFEISLGYSEAELLSMPIFDFIHPDDREEIQHNLQSVLAEKDGDGVIRLENRAICKDGSIKWLSWSAIVVDDLVFCVARDVTEEKRLENQRIQLEVDRQMVDLRQNFISIVSHELRTPLSVILLSSEILIRYDGRLENERRLQHYTQLVYQARLMRSMIEEILLLNRFNSDAVKLNLERVSLDGLCREIVDTYNSQSSRVTIDYTNSSQLEHIVTDEGLLRHVLDNLLSNAVKYSLPESRTSFKVFSDEQNVTFVFEDQGIGIPLEDQPQLFVPFQRASNVGGTPGTGLGLAIVKQSVDKLGGTVEISSEHEVGTTVTVKIPNFSSVSSQEKARI